MGGLGVSSLIFRHRVKYFILYFWRQRGKIDVKPEICAEPINGAVIIDYKGSGVAVRPSVPVCVTFVIKLSTYVDMSKPSSVPRPSQQQLSYYCELNFGQGRN